MAFIAIQVDAATFSPVSTQLHTESAAQNAVRSQSDNPADVLGGSTYGLTQVAASVNFSDWVTDPNFYYNPNTAWGSASISANVQPERIEVDVNSDFSWGRGAQGSGAASGTITFDLPVPATLLMTLNGGGHIGMSAKISSGGTEYFYQGWRVDSPYAPPPYTSVLTLPAGRYDILFGASTHYLVGTGGTGSMTFSVTPVPEPATFCLLGFGSVALLARRRREVLS
jgi:hypothetical protein